VVVVVVVVVLVMVMVMVLVMVVVVFVVVVVVQNYHCISEAPRRDDVWQWRYSIYLSIIWRLVVSEELQSSEMSVNIH